MKLLICGDRKWTNISEIAEVIDSFSPTCIITGTSSGAEKIAREIAAERGIELITGVRSSLLDHEPDLITAFHVIMDSKKMEARNLIAEAGRKDLPVVFYFERV